MNTSEIGPAETIWLKYCEMKEQLEDAQGEIRALRATEAGLQDRIAAIEADRAQRVPDGWMLVPVEPTEEMLVAGDDVLHEAFRDRCIATRTIYDAMLASTPAQPAQQEPSEAEMVCAEAYQVVGCLLSDLGLFETEPARKILDNLSEARMVHQDVLPWESAAAHQEPPQPVERKPMTEEQRQALYIKAHISNTATARQAFYEGLLLAERHHGIRE